MPLICTLKHSCCLITRRVILRENVNLDDLAMSGGSGGPITDSSSTHNPAPSTPFKSNGELLITTHIFSPCRVLHAVRFSSIFIFLKSSTLLRSTYIFLSLFGLVSTEESAVDAESGGSKHAKYPRLNQPTTGQAAYHFEIG